ncbi:MAG: glycine/betaine/sarcosine/D-proline family reductase selenoprotein B [Chloroflexales bacterium]|nr:glycine/betaine/sarcosine/D-proline family reductase selenoprotein B [Chloroflexales bacterium]
MQILENRDQWLAAFREGWLAHLQTTGEYNWKLYQRPRNSTAPAGPGVDLRNSRLMLISSAGGYLSDSQPPFDAASLLGDYAIRVFPSSIPLRDLAFAHEHYDHTAVNEDPQVLIPLRHLDNMVAAGAVGELSPSMVSFMGYQPDATRVVDETIPLILKVAQAEQVQAALLVPS